MDRLAYVRDFYARRDFNDGYEQQWGYANPVAAAYWRMRDEIVFAAVKNYLQNLTCPPMVLEVGTGFGHELIKFAQLAIPKSNLVGVDIISDRLLKAQALYPGVNFSLQDGAQLAFADSSFDVICQFTCLMHAMSLETQAAFGQEMARVLKMGGMIIWWDVAPLRWRIVLLRRACDLLLRRRSLMTGLSLVKQSALETLIPSLRDAQVARAVPEYTLPISRQSIAQIFPQMRIRSFYVGLDYRLWDFIWQRHRALAEWLWRTNWLWQHCFAVIEKPKVSI